MNTLNFAINNKKAAYLGVLALALFAVYVFDGIGSNQDTIEVNSVQQTTVVDLDPKQINSALGFSELSYEEPESVSKDESKPLNRALENTLQELSTPPPSLEQIKKTHPQLSFGNPDSETPEIRERREKTRARLQAARDGDWEAFLKSAEELQSTSPKLFDVTLLRAITYDAPMNVFKELLTRGARFLPLHLDVLVRSNKVHMTQGLMGLGLDIHMETEEGDNAINFVLETISAREMFKFLLYHGVEVQNGSKIEDPLMVTLLKAEKEHGAIFFAYQLIRYGEMPGSEHLRQAQRLQSINPRAFQLIQKNVPELI